MYARLLHNSYVIAIITFVLLAAFFYIFKFGYTTQYQPEKNYLQNENDPYNEVSSWKVVKRFSWKYPLAIALIVWLFWHFYLYPPKNLEIAETSQTTGQNFADKTPPSFQNIPRFGEISSQKINMINWN
ncbi:MAG: hypothetical protein QW303_00320 [Nitrososphaerota archaeon]